MSTGSFDAHFMACAMADPGLSRRCATSQAGAIRRTSRRLPVFRWRPGLERGHRSPGVYFKRKILQEPG